MELNPYLAFDGKCEEAFKFYEQALRGKILMMMTYADGPMAAETVPDQRSKIMHARMTVGETVLMGSDAPPGRFKAMQGCMVSLNVEEAAEADRAFQALAAGGAVTMPIAETFWAKRFGMLTDRFGTQWMVNCEKPM